MVDDDFLTSRQLAKRWGLGYSTIRHWRVFGVGPRYNRFGGRVKYHIKDIEYFEKMTNIAHTSQVENIRTLQMQLTQLQMI